MIQVPVISLQEYKLTEYPNRDTSVKFRPDPTEDVPHGLAEELGRALHEVGFATIVDHGLDTYWIHEAYKYSRDLFRYPDATLLRHFARPELGGQRGYTGFKKEHAKDSTYGDLKRFWHIGSDHNKALPNVWPDMLVPSFGRHMRGLFVRLEALALRILNLLDVYLGFRVGTLSAMMEGGDSILRVLHYPEIQPGWQGVRAGAHEDINLITLLVAATASGLEVQTKDGTWFPVNEAADSIVVNVADMLQLLTRGQLVSTTHRVVNVADGDRFSMPFFAHPRGEVVLHAESGYTAGEYLLWRLIEIGLVTGDLSALRPPPTF